MGGHSIGTFQAVVLVGLSSISGCIAYGTPQPPLIDCETYSGMPDCCTFVTVQTVPGSGPIHIDWAKVPRSPLQAELEGDIGEAIREDDARWKRQVPVDHAREIRGFLEGQETEQNGKHPASAECNVWFAQRIVELGLKSMICGPGDRFPPERENA